MSIRVAAGLGNLQVCRRPLYLNATTRACTSPCTRVVVGDPWRPDGHQPTPAPPPPPPALGGAVQVECPRSPPVYAGCSVASGTSPAGPMGREAPSAPWDPFNCRAGHGTLAPAVRHTTCAVRQSRSLGPPQSDLKPHPPPCPGNHGAARQYVSVTWRLRCPSPYLPRWAQCQAPLASPPGPGAPGLHTPRGSPPTVMSN